MKFHSYKDAKFLMESIEKRYGGNKESKKVQRTLLKQQYENFAGSSSEIMDQTFDRLQKLITQLEIQGEIITQEDMNLKLLRSLPSKWKTHALIWRNKQEIKTMEMGVDWMLTSMREEYPKTLQLMWDTTSQEVLPVQILRQILLRLIMCKSLCLILKEQYDNLSFRLQRFKFNLVSYKASLESVEARLSHYKKNMKLEKQKKREYELKLTLEKFQNSSKSLNNLLESQVIDKFKTGLGYNAASSTAASPAVESFVNSSEMLENQEYNKSKSDKGYHVVPPPFIRNFIPRKPDLTFMDEIVESENMDVTTVVTPSNVKTIESNLESAGVKSNGDAVEPKTISKNSFRPPVIED
ncbi:hypothetical protein Tco_0984998 [Tanacetum coccineum]